LDGFIPAQSDFNERCVGKRAHVVSERKGEYEDEQTERYE